MESTLSSPPASATSIGTRRNKFFMPLSSHGMPKAPAPSSPGGSVRSHRFDNSLASPRSFYTSRTRNSSITSPPMTPMSFQFQSPPLSARSFGTFIESEPSTPGFSPQLSPEPWSNSSIMMLSPISSTPSSPPEPKWDMMTPTRKPSTPFVTPMTSPSYGLRITSDTSLSSHPAQPYPEESQKENLPPVNGEGEVDPDAEPKPEEQPAPTAPLEKLASRMKSILRRRGTTSERKEKRRQRVKEEYYHPEDVHWTEM